MPALRSFTGYFYPGFLLHTLYFCRRSIDRIQVKKPWLYAFVKRAVFYNDTIILAAIMASEKLALIINSIPAVTASDDEIYRHWLAISDPQYFSYVTQYSAFDVQAARELGYYGYDTKPFKQYLSLKTTKDYLRRLMVPDGQEHIKWTSALVKRTEKFLEKNDYPMIFIYGAIDPWTASGVTDPKFFKGKENMHLFNDEGNSHRAKIGNVSAKNRNEILRLLTEWLGEQPFVQ